MTIVTVKKSHGAGGQILYLMKSRCNGIICQKKCNFALDNELMLS